MELAEFGTGQVFWSFLWFFTFLVWVMMLFYVFSDVFRSTDMTGAAKAAWAIIVIILPFLGVFLYLIVRGSKMSSSQRSTS
jgi:hypothetical protein